MKLRLRINATEHSLYLNNGTESGTFDLSQLNENQLQVVREAVLKVLFG